MAKKLKSAAEIAEFIRQALKEPELRVAVYSGPHGWNAKAYAAPHVVLEIQMKVNKVSRELQMLYELQCLLFPARSITFVALTGLCSCLSFAGTIGGQ